MDQNQVSKMISVKNLLRLDRILRIPYRLIWHLFCWSRSRKSKIPSDRNKVVIIKFMGMGSIIKLASLLRNREVEPGRIVFCTFASNLELCDLLGFRQRILINTQNPLVFLGDAIRMLRKVIQIRPKYLIDMERCSNTVGIFRTIMALTSNCETVSFSKSSRPKGTPWDKVFSMKEKTHEESMVQGLAILEGLKTASTFVSFSIEPLKIIVNANASDYVPSRRYPRDLTLELIHSLNKIKPDLKYCLTGSLNEFGYVEDLAKSLREMEISVENVAGIWNLPELVDQLASCKLFITNDSGPMHLAAFLGVPTVAIWGPTHYRYFGYENLSHVHNISLDLECSPCFKDPTSKAAIYCQKRIDCMQNLSPNLIVKQVEHLLLKTENERRVTLPAGMANTQLENVSDTLEFQN